MKHLLSGLTLLAALGLMAASCAETTTVTRANTSNETTAASTASSENDQRREEIAAIGAAVTEDYLARDEFMMYEVGDVVAVHYAEAATAYGGAKLAGLTGRSDHIAALAARHQRVIDEAIPNTQNHVDTNVYGVWPLELYLQTNEWDYYEYGIFLADDQWAEPLPNGLSDHTRFWIDDVWMIGALQMQAWRSTGDSIYRERAARTAAAYIDRLQQENGMFHHGPDAPFYWGRGNGWVAAGFADIISDLPETNPYYDEVVAGYRKMMAALLEYQAEDGMWRQLIDDPDAWKETSGTAMFGYAMTVGVNRGLLDEATYGPAAEKAWDALVTYIGEDGRISDVCVGTGQSQEADYYLNRPTVTGDLHGQAPVLWFATAILEGMGAEDPAE